jgi:hypothetical protein
VTSLENYVFQDAVEFQTNTAGLSSHTDRHVPQFHKIMENYSHVPQSQTLNKISSTSPGDFAPTQGEFHVAQNRGFSSQKHDEIHHSYPVYSDDTPQKHAIFFTKYRLFTHISCIKISWIVQMPIRQL